MSIFIEVKNLSLTINNEKILKNICFTVEEGEIIGILGKSGSGKTILMNILKGSESYENVTGSVLYHITICDNCNNIDLPSKDNKDCEICKKGKMKEIIYDFVKNSVYDKLKRKISKKISIMIQRTFALYGDENVINNITNALLEVGIDDKSSLNKAMEILEEVNMSNKLLHIARDLSGGEKQRVVLARQLIKKPFLLLADEPTGTLDPMNANIVHNVIINCVKKYNMTLILTSHWPKVISTLSKKSILLENGEIKKIGDSKELVNIFMKNLTINDNNTKLNSFKSPIIKIKNLSKKYISVDRGIIKALESISFEINENEIFGIVGVSGSGKTTLSKIIMGIVPPTSGEIFVRIGDDWVDMKIPGVMNKGRATKYMGLLHQEYSLYPYTSIIGNLTDSIGLDLPYELGVRKAIKTLSIAGFQDEKAESILDKNTIELSEGERHRVAMAQVLMKEPKIVIMDEPTGTMDPITRTVVTRSILNARNNLNETFVIVSHDIDFVQEICDRVALINNGKLISVGYPKEVLKGLEFSE